MSSALKPALPATGGQTSPGSASSAASKPLTNAQNLTQHSGAPTPYAPGSLGHVPQNLAGLPHAHGNIGMPATNSATMAANMSMNAMPNMSQMGSHPGMNQVAPLNVPGPAKGPTLPSGVTASATATAHGRPAAHPFLSNTGVAPPQRDDEGTTIPASQNSAQLMAMHRAQQQHHPPPHTPQHHEQQQPNAADKFKQQQQQQTPPPQQSQSNGTASAPAEATCNKTTVPAPPAPADSKSDPPAPPAPTVQNHVPAAPGNAHEPNNVKQPTDAASPTVGNASVPPAAQPAVEVEPKPTVATPPAAEPAAEPAQQATTTPTKPVVPKETPKTPSTLKLATTPRTTNRKREIKTAKVSESPKSNASSPTKTPDGRSPGAQNNRPPDKVNKAARTPSEERKSKRTRTRTQPYQSPLPELALITKLSSGSGSPSKAQDEKLIVFYKNEFLAVRNAEGGFYVCQAVQNVYKSSPRIRIRWLSQDKHDKIYIPDFYDFTDFDCILTNINMERVEKGKYNLPKDELERTENILKRALAVESGASAPSLTEEHPDGLDLSLFRDESQLKKKRKALKRKSMEPLSADNGNISNSRTKRTPEKAKLRKLSRTSSSKSSVKRNNQQTLSDRKTTNNAGSGISADKRDGGRASRRSDGGRAERAKRRGESSPAAAKTSPVVDQKKARVLAKVAMKTAIPAASVQNKKKGKPTPAAKPASSSAAPASKPATKTSTRSQASAPSVSAATTSAPSTRRGKKTKK